MTMTRALAAAALFFAGPAMGQDLDRAYFQLCADGQQTETCTVLSQAIARKQENAEAAQPTSDEGQQATPAWEVSRKLVAKEYWYAPGNILRFSYPRVNALVVEDVLSGQSGTLHAEAGRLIFSDEAGDWTGTILPSGYTITSPDKIHTRTYTVSPDGSQITLVRKIWWRNAWSEYPVAIFRPMSPIEVAEAAARAARATDPASIAANWGILGDRAGRSFVFDQEHVDGQIVNAYNWDRKGLSLSMSQAVVTDRKVTVKPILWTQYAFDPLLGKIIGSNVVVQSDGSLTYDYGDARVVSVKLPSGGYVETTERLSGTKWKKRVTLEFRPVSSDLEQTLAALTAPKARSANGGLFGTLLGAAVGGVAAVASGADAATAANLAMQGAVVTSGNSQMAAAMAKGSAEVAASNAQMKTQLQGSINRGLAQGTAQYRAEQTGPQVESHYARALSEPASRTTMQTVVSDGAGAKAKSSGEPLETLYYFCSANAKPLDGGPRDDWYLSRIAPVQVSTRAAAQDLVVTPPWRSYITAQVPGAFSINCFGRPDRAEVEAQMARIRAAKWTSRSVDYTPHTP